MVWDKKWGFKERLKLKVLFFRKGIDIVIYFRICYKILIKILILLISNYLNNKNDIYTSIYFGMFKIYLNEILKNSHIQLFNVFFMYVYMYVAHQASVTMEFSRQKH